MTYAEEARRRMTFCAICGEALETGNPVTALLTVRAPSGRTAAFGAHGQCVIDLFHPNARAIIDSAPIIPDID